MRRSKPAVLFIIITLLLDTIGLGIIIPVLPKLVQELTGATLSETSGPFGWLISVYAIMSFLFSPLLGALSDRYGRRPVLLLTLAGMIVNYTILGFAPSLFWLFLGRIIAGMSGANVATAYAYIADVTPVDKRAQNFGLIGAAFGLGFIIGPGIGGLLGAMNVRAPFIGAGLLTLLNLLYGIFILPESLPAGQRRAFDLKRANPFGALFRLRKFPFMLGLMTIYLLIALAAQAPQTIWVLFTEYRFGWTTQQVGFSLGVLGLAFGISQGWLVRYIIPWLGERKTLVAGLLLYMTGMALYGAAFAPWLFFVGLLPHAFGILIVPAIQSLASRETPPNAQGELQGAFNSLTSLANIFGPLVATQLFMYFSGENAVLHLPGMPFFTSAGILLAAFALIIPTFRRLAEHEKT